MRTHSQAIAAEKAAMNMENADPPQITNPIETGASTSADSTRLENMGSPRIGLRGAVVLSGSSGSAMAHAAIATVPAGVFRQGGLKG